MALSPVARPRIAVTIGSDIAAAVPKAINTMITAAVSPIASLDSVAGLETSWPK
jgi:hypothetical protein